MNDRAVFSDLPPVAVCDLPEARLVWRDYDAVISIENDGLDEQNRMTAVAGVPHLVLAFTDIDFIDHERGVAELRHLEQAVAFARRNAGKRLLIHCHAGRYRSPAVALAVLADVYGPGREREAVRALLAIRPVAAPNLIALIHADEALGRHGALHAAWMAHEATDPDIGRRRQGRHDIEARMLQERRIMAGFRDRNGKPGGYDPGNTDMPTFTPAPWLDRGAPTSRPR